VHGHNAREQARVQRPDAASCACGCSGVARPGRRYVHGHHGRRPFTDRFWEKVHKTEGCWLWTAASKKEGYGVIGAPDKPRRLLRAHRVSWEMAHGPIPPGMDVCHRCDVPACVRVDHLFLGAAADNLADMFAKGRQPDRRGEQGKRNKLSALDVQAIRAMHRAGDIGYRQLARRFGVDRTTIRAVIVRRSWDSLP
jgi:hypothetical protein